MNNYVPLHVHDEDASIGDSILNLKAYVKKGKAYGLPALSITNHGSMASMYKFYALCKKYDMKCILGIEAYVTCDNNKDLLTYAQADTKERKKLEYTPGQSYHCVLIALNDTGLKNALYLTSYGATQTFYKKPLISEEVLFEHNEGLLCLSACVGGLIPQMILQQKEEDVIKNKIQQYAQVFKNRFYLELQPGRFQEQTIVNMHLVRYAKMLGIPLVATNDIHYLDKNDAVIHNMHVADYRKKQLSVDDPLIYKDDCFYLMKQEELKLMGVDLATTKEAIRNTQVIADMCENIALPEQVQMPIYDRSLSATETKHLLSTIAFNKLNRITHTVSDPYAYSERLIYEINVIEKLGYVDYFLIIWDALKYARDNNIGVGPGRGSVGGSLLAYLLDITCVDPVKYGLIFERFLSEYRTGSIPDIDMDFESARRDEMFVYMQNRYGYDHCAQVSTVGIRKAKSAIKDAARALNIENYIEVSQTIADLIPTVFYGDAGDKETDLDIKRALQISEPLRDYQNQYPDLFRVAIGLQNKPKNDGVHAAGILVFPHKLQDYLPLRLSKKPTLPATALSLKYAEYVAIKFDFLGLRTIDMNKSIEKMTGFVFDYDNENLYSDEAPWNVLGSQYNAGLFQVSSNTYKKRMCRLKPKTIEELAACLALVRGPCISSGLDERYMRILEGREKIEYVHPIYDNATKDTLGIMIYQEQSMQMFQNAGMSSERSFELMKLMTKKKEEEAKAYQKEFCDGCIAQGATQKQIDYMWYIVTESAKYSFNKSHAVAYALMAFKTAYYKAHFSKQFFTALLTHEFNSNGDAKKQAQIISGIVKEVKAYGYNVVLPDINTCDEEFKIVEDSNQIMAGTCAIKGFGNSLSSMQMYGTITEMKDLFGGRPAYEKGEITKKACDDIWKAIPVASKSSVIAGIFAGLFDAVYDGNKSRKDIYEEYMTLRKSYTNATAKELIEETVKITSQLSIKTSQSNKALEKAIYGVSF